MSWRMVEADCVDVGGGTVSEFGASSAPTGREGPHARATAGGRVGSATADVSA